MATSRSEWDWTWSENNQHLVSDVDEKFRLFLKYDMSENLIGWIDRKKTDPEFPPVLGLGQDEAARVHVNLGAAGGNLDIRGIESQMRRLLEKIAEGLD